MTLICPECSSQQTLINAHNAICTIIHDWVAADKWKTSNLDLMLDQDDDGGFGQGLTKVLQLMTPATVEKIKAVLDGAIKACGGDRKPFEPYLE